MIRNVFMIRIPYVSPVSQTFRSSVLWTRGCADKWRESAITYLDDVTNKASEASQLFACKRDKITPRGDPDSEEIINRFRFIFLINYSMILFSTWYSRRITQGGGFKSCLCCLTERADFLKVSSVSSFCFSFKLEPKTPFRNSTC